jgi:hypothetical protein
MSEGGSTLPIRGEVKHGQEKIKEVQREARRLEQRLEASTEELKAASGNRDETRRINRGLRAEQLVTLTDLAAFVAILAEELSED